MRFSTEWQDNAQNAAPEERATIADLRLWLGEQNVTLHLDGRASVDHLTISLYGLAEGLAHDWWRIFGARDRTFSLMDYRSGYAVPDLRMSFDGAAFQFEAHQRTYQNPDIRFWAGSIEVMDRAEAERQLGELIQKVLERLVERGLQDTSAKLRWERVQASRADSDEASFCEAAGALGLDAYQIDNHYADLIDDAASLFEGEPLNEFLAGAKGTDERQLIDWVDTVERRPGYQSRIAELRDISIQVASDAASAPRGPGWSLGYRRARSMRKALGLGENQRFRSYRTLAERLGASKSFRLTPNVDGIHVLRSDHENGVRLHMRSPGSSTKAHELRLFTFCRAVGDVACFPQEGRAPINSLTSAYRQAAGRAFAAEFLAPIHEIRSMQESGRDVVSIAEEFSVSTTVIERQIENGARIESTCG